MGDEHALQPADERVDAAPRRVGRDEDGARLEDDGAEDLEPLLAERAAGLDHVGDGVGDAEAHGRLHGAVEADQLDVDPLTAEEVADEAGVARRDPLALELAEAGEAPDRPREAERRGAEVELL